MHVEREMPRRQVVCVQIDGSYREHFFLTARRWPDTSGTLLPRNVFGCVYLHARMQASTYARTLARERAHTHARTHARTHAHTHTRTHARTHARTLTEITVSVGWALHANN